MHFDTFSTLDELSYHSIADETLDAIAELFDDLGESPSSPADYDVQMSVSVNWVIIDQCSCIAQSSGSQSDLAFTFLDDIFLLQRKGKRNQAYLGDIFFFKFHPLLEPELIYLEVSNNFKKWQGAFLFSCLSPVYYLVILVKVLDTETRIWENSKQESRTTY